jgi:hypothetical protein
MSLFLSQLISECLRCVRVFRTFGRAWFRVPGEVSLCQLISLLLNGKKSM